jgi:hypothetical protein
VQRGLPVEQHHVIVLQVPLHHVADLELGGHLAPVSHKLQRVLVAVLHQDVGAGPRLGACVHMGEGRQQGQRRSRGGGRGSGRVRVSQPSLVNRDSMGEEVGAGVGVS